MEQLLFGLLLKMDMNKLFKFYWKKKNQMLIFQMRFFCFFFFFFLFQFLIFLFFFNVKYGRTPLFIAAEEGQEQIVQILLEKGNPNVDLPDKVILLIVSFSFLFLFFSFLFSFSFFYFFYLKYGVTPLYIAACEGHEQIVQILLEKGEPNVDLPDQVLLLFVFFFYSFSFQFLIFLFFFMERVEELLF